MNNLQIDLQGIGIFKLNPEHTKEFQNILNINDDLLLDLIGMAQKGPTPIIPINSNDKQKY